MPCVERGGLMLPPAFLTGILGWGAQEVPSAPLVDEAPECGEEEPVGTSGLLWLFTGSRSASVSLVYPWGCGVQRASPFRGPVMWEPRPVGTCTGCWLF